MDVFKRVAGLVVICTGLVLISQAAFGWGFWAHHVINKEAVTLLPEPLRDFYATHVDYLVEHSTDPDTRREAVKNEGYSHYMDMDRYGTYPDFHIPASYQEAVAKYGEETVLKNGIVTWRVGWEVDSLSAAMKKHDIPLILHLSADLGHYVADMHVPLHATKNYDGQMTGNIGVHYRWESGIPERFGKDYNYANLDSIRYVKNPVEHALRILEHSYSLLPEVFDADSLAKIGISKNDLYKVEEKNGRREYIYSEEYYRKFNTELNGMVEAQIRRAVTEVASYWYTAWVNAGKPNF